MKVAACWTEMFDLVSCATPEKGGKKRTFMNVKSRTFAPIVSGRPTKVPAVAPAAEMVLKPCVGG